MSFTMRSIWVIISLLIYLNSSFSISLFGQNSENDTTKKIEKKDTVFKKIWISNQYTYGVDVERYNGDIDSYLINKKKYLAFIMFPVTEGLSIQDSSQLKNIEKSKVLQLHCGAYHIFDCSQDAKEQAKIYLEYYAMLSKTDLPPIVKITRECLGESDNIYDIQMRLLTFLAYIKKKQKLKAIIYTDLAFANTFLNDVFFAGYPIWIAGFKDKTRPELPKAWKITLWTFWQKNFNYTYNTNSLELELFNGSYADFMYFIKEHKRVSK